MSEVLRLSRRSFLKFTGTATGGLLILIYSPSSMGSNESSFSPNAFIRIDADGTITLWSKNPDMGQGVKTSMPMILAEELEADWTKVRVEQADLNEKIYGGQGSGGSDSIHYDWDNLRKAGAVARELLIAAAAQTWNVDPKQCAAQKSEVLHAASKRKLSYGQLVSVAATLPIPKELPPLKDPKTFRIVSTRVTGVDTKNIVRGHPLYGLDVVRPGMLYAVLAKNPVFAGKPLNVNDEKTRAVPGVRHVVTVNGHDNPTFLQPSVAVVADSLWAALKGRDALQVEWEEGPIARESTEAMAKEFEELAKSPGKILRDSGDVNEALHNTSKVFDVSYQLPFLSHATLEPQNCTAVVANGKCEIWGPLQMPESGQRVVSTVTGLPPEAIAVHMTRIGGGFGRRLLSDYAAEAAYVSQKVGAPVKVVWTRTDDLQHDYYRPATYHRIRAGLSNKNELIAWHHHLVSISRNTYRKSKGNPEDTDTYGLFHPRSGDPKMTLAGEMVPTLIPNCRIEYTEMKTGIPTGALRAPSHNGTAFVIQSTLHEIAHSAGIDFIELQKKILGKKADYVYPQDDPTPYTPERLIGVLEMVAEKAGWGKRLPEGHAMGLAAHFVFGGYAAEAVELSVDRKKKIKIHRIVAAVDCGIPVNISGIEQQAQGGILDGLSSAMYGEITVERGRTKQTNFDDYPLLRITGVPPVELHIIPSNERPTGFGEIAFPALPPALGNAIFAATGERVRRLPFARSGYTL
jgi:isoquinoline 1-oxidoreductase beta subunit